MDLAALLSDRAIKVRSYRPGSTSHVLCPKCAGGNKHELSFAVTIDADGQGFAALCHRGSCGHKEGVRLRDRDYIPPANMRPPAPIQKPRPHSETQRSSRPQWLWDFFGEREIGARVIEALGIYAIADKRFPQLDGVTQAVVFPYVHEGELVNRKYRTAPPDKYFTQDSDALPTLFNVDRLGPDPEEIIFVEGEMDVCACFECGIENVVSLKDGAPKEATFKPDDKRFEALRTHADLLGKPKRIILAGDMDGPGLALREELARRLGRHRVWLVIWPEGCKDACDVLRLHGPDSLTDAIRAAAPYPIAGLQRVQAGTLQALRRQSPPETMTTGCYASNQILHLPTEGRLIIVTGFAGSGKTTWTRFVMVHTAGEHHRRWLAFSPEMQPWEQFAAECAEVLMNKPFWPKNGLEGMTEGEVETAEQWLSDRITMLVCDAEDEAPSLDWILERAKLAVLRDGITDLLIDPWNEVAHDRGDMTETDYIGRALQRLKAFGQRYGVNIWIIAHPAKPLPIKPGEKRAAPGPYDISGSQHWANKADLGLTVHSPEEGRSDLHLWKSRFSRWGKRTSVATMNVNLVTGRYSTPPTIGDTDDLISKRFGDDQ